MQALNGPVLAAALLLAGATFSPAVTGAQPEPPADAVRPSYSSAEETVRGRIISFDGNDHLEIRDDRGFVDTVTLHDGTIINPTGIRLAPGMRVTVYGVNRGRELAANQIDTPYQSYGAVAPPVAYAYPYPPAYAYGYPAYGYPYSYPYGPRFSFGIGIGFGPHFGYGRWR